MVSESSGMDKVANLLALLLVKDMSKSVAASVLANAGFATREIAALLGTTEGSVRAYLSQARKRAEKPNDG